MEFPKMNWKKIITKGLDAVELVSRLWPSSDEMKQRAIEENDNIYDAAYYSGKMSYGLAESCKEEFRNKI